MCRPNPMPRRSRRPSCCFVVKNGSKILSMCSGLIPQPVSATSIASRPPGRGRAVIFNVPPFSIIACRALITRLKKNLLQRTGRGVNLQVLRHIDRQRDVVLFEIAAQAFHRVTNQRQDKRVGRAHLIVHRHSQDTIAQCRKAQGVLVRLLDGGAYQLRIASLNRIAAIADDRREDIVELVGQHRGDRAQRSQTLETLDLELKVGQAALQPVQVLREIAFRVR